MNMNVGNYGGYYTSKEFYQRSDYEKEHESIISSQEYEAVLKEKDPELLAQMKSITSQVWNRTSDGTGIREVFDKARAYVYEARKEMGVGETDGTSYGNVKLSKRAQEMLEKLKKTYGNMDFMVADFRNGADAKAILARGTKEFSVLLSPEELEKMASDEKYEKEYMAKIDGAVRMSEQINEQFGYERGFGKDYEKGSITKVGMAFASDGTVTYFAELEKTTAKQSEFIEKMREKRAEEKKAAEKDSVTTRATIQASSPEDLISQLKNFDWSKVTEEQKTEGGRIDFSV